MANWNKSGLFINRTILLAGRRIAMALEISQVQSGLRLDNKQSDTSNIIPN